MKGFEPKKYKGLKNVLLSESKLSNDLMDFFFWVSSKGLPVKMKDLRKMAKDKSTQIINHYSAKGIGQSS